MEKRKALYHRTKLLGSDVADALRDIMATLDGKVPQTISKPAVVKRLVDISNTDDEGIVTYPGQAALRSVTLEFQNTLQMTAIFQSGYEQYCEETGNPVVPVTDYYFERCLSAFGNGDADDTATLDTLAVMTDTDIKQALPKKPSPMLEISGDKITEVRNEQGEVLKAGRIAGVVVFPPGFASPLLARWLQRLTASAIGQVEHSTNALGRARPDSQRVEDLRQSAGDFNRSAKKALPPYRPK